MCLRVADCLRIVFGLETQCSSLKVWNLSRREWVSRNQIIFDCRLLKKAKCQPDLLIESIDLNQGILNLPNDAKILLFVCFTFIIAS